MTETHKAHCGSTQEAVRGALWEHTGSCERSIVGLQEGRKEKKRASLGRWGLGQAEEDEEQPGRTAHEESGGWSQVRA